MKKTFGEEAVKPDGTKTQSGGAPHVGAPLTDAEAYRAHVRREAEKALTKVAEEMARLEAESIRIARDGEADAGALGWKELPTAQEPLTMPESAQQNRNVDFGAYRTHLCLVSDQAAANFLPIVLHRPENVVLFVSEKMKEAADMLEQAVRTASPATKVHRCGVENPNDDEEVSDKVYEQLDAFAATNPIVNVTGGTKLMAFGALTAAYGAGFPAFYLNQEDNRISILRSGSGRHREVVPPIEVRLNLKTYLAAYGYEAGSGALPSLTYDEEQFIGELIKSSTLHEVVPALNALAVDAKDKPGLTIEISGIGAGREEAFKTLCDYFRSSGHLQIRGKTLKFPTEADRFFVAGGWLERYVCGLLTRMNFRPQANLVVRNQVKNEIDVALMHDGRFCIVECKTGRLDKIEEANKVIYKLETLKKLGGLNTRLILVTYQALQPESLARARKSGIRVIAVRSPAQLPSELRNAITEKK